MLSRSCCSDVEESESMMEVMSVGMAGALCVDIDDLGTDGHCWRADRYGRVNARQPLVVRKE